MSGFHKRKKKRRKEAEKKQEEALRRKRLELRKKVRIYGQFLTLGWPLFYGIFSCNDVAVFY